MKDDACTVASAIGPITITGNERAITGISFTDMSPASGASRHPSLALLAEAARQIEAYLAGRLTMFSLPLDPRGSGFQRKVWSAMCAIPYGETATYGTIAAELRSSPRAVGGACGRNPIPLVIPCHRVVAATGLGGYSGGEGLATKRWLLALERELSAARVA